MTKNCKPKETIKNYQLLYTNRKKAAQSQTVQALQTPMLQKQQQQRISTAGGIIENPAFKYQGAPHNTPNITRFDGNTEVVHRDAITRMNENQRTTSTDNLLNS